MYESFYGLKDRPFSMLPDPGYLYLSKKHQMALTMLEYALFNNAGFCIISGEIGAGKTTLLRKLLESMESHISVGMITNTHSSFGELLDWVLSAYNIHKPGLNKVEMNQVFLDYLLDQYSKKKTVLLIVDEAQNLSVDTMEELRMLSNINSGKDQLLQIILAGQPELRDTLRLPVLRQFAQRIAVDYHLGALNVEETDGYIDHRLHVAGASRKIFTEGASERIHMYSGGVPRLINLLCDTCMVYGFADQAEVIDEYLVDDMVRERMADSLVPIVQQAHPDSSDTDRRGSTERRASKSDSPDKGAESPAPSKLSKISPEQKKQPSGSPAEKKTITDAPRPRQPIAVHPQAARVAAGQHAAARLQAVAAQPQQELEEESVQIAARASEPEIAAAETAEPKIAEENKPEAKSKVSPDLSEKIRAATSAQRDNKPAEAVKPEEETKRWQNRVEVVSVPAPEEPASSWFNSDRFGFGTWSIGGVLILAVVVIYFLFSGSSSNSVPASHQAQSSTASTNSQQAATSGQQDSYAARMARRKARQLARQQAIEAAQKSMANSNQDAQKQNVSAVDSGAAAKAKEAAVQAKLMADAEAKLKAEAEANAKAEADASAKAKALAAAKAKAEQKKIALLKLKQQQAAIRKAERARAAEQAKAAAAKARAAELEAKLQAEQQAAAQARAQAAAAEAQARQAQAQTQELQQKQQPAVKAPKGASVKTVASIKSTTTVAAKNHTSNKQVVDPELEFTTDPCQGPSAKFLSTCSK